METFDYCFRTDKPGVGNIFTNLVVLLFIDDFILV